MGQAASLVLAQVPAREGRRGRLGQRQHLEAPGQLLQGAGIFGAIAADPGAAQPDQVAAGAQGRAEVAGQGPDVGAARAAHGGVEVEQVPVAADIRDRELVDRHRPGRQLGRGARPGQPVGALAVDLDRADRGRHLLDLAGEPGHRRHERFRGNVRRGGGAGDLALGVVRAGRLAEPDRGVVFLLGQRQVAEQPGGLLHADHQDAGRHRVQRPGVAHLPGPGQPPDPGHDIMRRHPARLVDDNEAGLVTRGRHSSSSSSSAGLR